MGELGGGSVLMFACPYREIIEFYNKNLSAFADSKAPVASCYACYVIQDRAPARLTQNTRFLWRV